MIKKTLWVITALLPAAFVPTGRSNVTADGFGPMGSLSSYPQSARYILKSKEEG